MPATATHLADAPRLLRRPAGAASVPAITARRTRVAVAAPRRYSLPVVREIPIPPADRAGDRTW
jgi:hypothetical protein